MGSVTPPPTDPRPTTKSPSGLTPAGGTPVLAGPAPTSRFRVPDRPVAMGPSGAAIVLTLAAVALGAWLYLKPPSTIGEQSLQRYVGFEANMESVVLRNCAPPGCAAVYLAPAAGRKSVDAIPAAVQLANQLSGQGIECFLILGGEPIPEAVKRARAFRRPVVFDPNGDWAKDSGIEKAPYWIAWRTGGKVRLRSEEPVTASDVASAIR
jgi:hypothetical protein